MLLCGIILRALSIYISTELDLEYALEHLKKLTKGIHILGWSWNLLLWGSERKNILEAAAIDEMAAKC